MGQFGVVELSPSNWKEFTDPKGRTYYHNQVTKVTQWKRPKVLQEQDWTEYKAPDGRQYYYNKYTKHTQWTKPEIPDDTEPIGHMPQTPQSPSSKDPLSPTPLDLSKSDKRTGDKPDDDDQQANGDTNEYYAILDLPITATPQEIKVGYRHLARRFHPDRNGFDPVGIDRFQRAQQAYSVLIDSHKRRVYDAFVAYCRAHKSDPSAYIPEFHAFLDLCDAMNVGIEPGTRDIPITICTVANPNQAIREWRQFSAEDEQRYFVNVRTGGRQWQKPVDLLEFDVCSRLMGLRDSIVGTPPPQVPVPHTPAQPYSHSANDHLSHQPPHCTPHYGAPTAAAPTATASPFPSQFPKYFSSQQFPQNWASSFSGGL